MYRILIRQITYHMICNYTLHTTQFHRFTLCTEKHNITITVIIIIIRFISNKFNRINLMFLLVVILFVHFEGINGGGKAPMLISIPREFLPKETVTEVEPTWEITITTTEPTTFQMRACIVTVKKIREDSEESSSIYQILLNLLHKLWAMLKYLLNFL
ncbi:unnamed protein product [Schistosoma haematobium]|nr:unnamed protein product [Schistosoma haematobium]